MTSTTGAPVATSATRATRSHASYGSAAPAPTAGSPRRTATSRCLGRRIARSSGFGFPVFGLEGFQLFDGPTGRGELQHLVAGRYRQSVDHGNDVGDRLLDRVCLFGFYLAPVGRVRRVVVA